MKNLYNEWTLNENFLHCESSVRDIKELTLTSYIYSLSAATHLQLVVYLQCKTVKTSYISQSSRIIIHKRNDLHSQKVEQILICNCWFTSGVNQWVIFALYQLRRATDRHLNYYLTLERYVPLSPARPSYSSICTTSNKRWDKRYTRLGGTHAF